MNPKDLQLLEDARMEAWHKGDKEEFDRLGEEGKKIELEEQRKEAEAERYLNDVSQGEIETF
jgi:hypothetical protein